MQTARNARLACIEPTPFVLDATAVSTSDSTHRARHSTSFMAVLILLVGAAAVDSGAYPSLYTSSGEVHQVASDGSHDGRPLLRPCARVTSFPREARRSTQLSSPDRCVKYAAR